MNNNELQDDEIDLKQLWMTVSRHKWQISGLAASFTLLAIIILFSITPIYKASTTIMLETQQANVVSIEQVYGIDGGNSEYYNSQIEVIKSRQVVTNVVKKLKLTTHPEFDPRQQKSSFDLDLKSLIPDDLLQIFEQFKTEEVVKTEAEILNGVIESVLEKLSVTAHKKSLIISISFLSASPELAVKFTDTLASSYIEHGYESNLQMTKDAMTWLTSRLGNIKKELEQSEKKLIDYRNRENLIDVKGVQTITADELKNISDKLIEARRERAQVQSIFNQIRSIKKPTIATYELIPGMFDNVVVQQAKQRVSEASQNVVRLSKRYGKKNPKLISAKDNLSKAQSNYFVLLKNIANGIEKKYQAARTNENALKRDLSKSKSEIRNINQKSYKLKELEREVDTNRQLYETFFTRFKETNETSGMRTANARIIDYAVLPTIPVKPKKKLIVIIVFVLSLGLGIVLTFINEALNTTIKSPEDIQTQFNVPLLGALPGLKLKKDQLEAPILEFIHNNHSNFSESIRTIRTGVVLSGLDSEYKVALITSSVPNEGKTTASLNLALSLGAMEKVLLIDADLRRPSIAKACGISSGNEGLSTLVAGTSDFNESIVNLPDWSIDVLPAGIVPPNPQELLSSKRFKKIIETLGKKYERIIIDTPPTQAVSDALILSKYANEVIYVIKADSTSQSLVRSGLDKLNQVDANISGLILNQLDFNKAQRYGDDYYDGYYSNYGYS